MDLARRTSWKSRDDVTDTILADVTWWPELTFLHSFMTEPESRTGSHIQLGRVGPFGNAWSIMQSGSSRFEAFRNSLPVEQVGIEPLFALLEV